MKRLVHYKLRADSKWLNISGVCMGIAFFLQALDYLALRTLQSVPVWQLILFMILPMALEAAWCVLVREKLTPKAEVVGIIGAVLCLMLLAQTMFCGNVLLMVIGAILFVLCGAVLVLITWGFIHHRALGMLVFFAAAVIRVLLFGLLPAVFSVNWRALLQELPALLSIVSIMFFFRGIYAQKVK